MTDTLNGKEQSMKTQSKQHQQHGAQGTHSMPGAWQGKASQHKNRKYKEVPIEAVSRGEGAFIDHVRQRKRPRIKAIRMAT